MAKSVSVVLAIKYLRDIVGGAERNVVDLANYLASAGYAVSIVTFEGKDGPPKFPLDERVHLVDAKVSSLKEGPVTSAEESEEASRREPYRSDPSAIEWFENSHTLRIMWSRVVRALRPNLIITFLPHTSTPLLEQIGSETPIIVTNQNAPKVDYYLEGRHDPSAFDRKKRLELLDKAAAIQVLIPDFVDELPERLRTKIKVVPNVVPPARRVKGIGAESRDIVAMGRLVPQKGFPILIEAMALVAKEFAEWRLHIYGRGDEEESLRLQIRQLSLQRNVLLRGRTGNPLAAMAASDIFVIPSEYEGWGLTLSEAMSTGLPCVGFADCSGVNWLLRQPDVGVLVEPRSPSALAEILNGLILDPKKRADYGHKARAFVKQFSPDAVYGQWDDLIKKVIAGDA